MEQPRYTLTLTADELEVLRALVRSSKVGRRLARSGGVSIGSDEPFGRLVPDADAGPRRPGLEVRPEREPTAVNQVEAARRLGVTTQTIRNWEKAGLLAGNLVRGTKLYPYEQVRALAHGRRTPG